MYLAAAVVYVVEQVGSISLTDKSLVSHGTQRGAVYVSA